MIMFYTTTVVLVFELNQPTVRGSLHARCREQYGLLHAIRLFNGIGYKYKTDNVKTIVVHTVVIHFNRWQLKPPIR